MSRDLRVLIGNIEFNRTKHSLFGTMPKLFFKNLIKS